MRRKSSKGRRKKVLTSQSKPQGTDTNVEDNNRLTSVQRTPTKPDEWFLQDERWDIEPKTDYTYARSGSYSPRFFGKKYVNPNMSRYRIRTSRRSSAGEDVDDEASYLQISDVDDEPDGHSTESQRDGQSGSYGGRATTSQRDGHANSASYGGRATTYQRDVQTTTYHGDSDSDGSFETVYEEGMELRSGKNLHSLRQSLHEHDSNLQQSDIVGTSTSRQMLLTTSLVESRSRSRKSMFDDNQNARNTKKLRKSDQNQRQYSQSERKRYSTSNVDSYSHSQDLNYSDVRSRRSLNREFAAGSQRDNYYSSANKSVDRYGNRYGYDDTDSRQTGYTVKTVRTTVTEDLEDSDNGVPEKGSTELSEKQTRLQRNRHDINHSYGLDSEDEFSDNNSSAYVGRSRRYGRANGSRYSTSTTSTVITTISETITTLTSPIVTPVWNAVGRPVWRHVGKPISAVIVSIITSLVYLAWLVVSQPLVLVVRTLAWVFRSAANALADSSSSVLVWFWRKLTYISMRFVLVDAWLLKRRRRSCCFCLPLLLLIPLALAFYAGGAELWGGRSSLFGFLRRGTMHPCIPTGGSGDSSQQLAYLNEEMQTLILQLQASRRSQLTEADVMAIVHRILAAEKSTLKADIDSGRNEDRLSMLQWKAEQEVRLDEMNKKQAVLIADIEDLESAISSHQTKVETDGDERKSASSLLMAGLQEKLLALQRELNVLKEEQAALALRMKDCCHNKSFYTAMVRENVEAVLAQMMKGQASGNPSQDAFMAWLHSNHVSKDALNTQLKTLSNDLTDSVMAKVEDMQEAQKLAAQSSQIHLSGDGCLGRGSIGEEHVRLMIEEALIRYSADRTGVPDFALESAGGTVVSTRCSETYYRKTALVSVFGLPLWYTSNSPRTVIQPDIHPGQCWAFRGTHGYIVIETSTTITPTGFTLEHIPKSLAPTGEIDSAPKEFTVLGLESEYDSQGTSLGNFMYNDNGKPLQFFPVQVIGSVKHFRLYEVKISSNYGNLEYTCLYRFRIHGKPWKS